MKAGDIALCAIAQANGQIKNRPVLLLKKMPPYNDWLVAGISSQLHQEVKGFDLLVNANKANGLKTDSLVRLGFLDVMALAEIKGDIGKIPDTLLRELLQRLSDYLKP